MKTFKTTTLAAFTLLFSIIYTFAQERTAAPADLLDGVKIKVTAPLTKDDQSGGESVLNNISSTAAGGVWSSPGTWVGGVVPGSGDNVTIVGGAAVMVDTAAAAGALTVGTGGTPAVLTFDPFTARSLSVSGDLRINGATDIFTTPGTGTVTNHLLTVGGSLTNNGIFDLSTNTNQAGADLIFTGASNNTFGGNGSVTDIRTITMNKGTSSANVLDLTASNFTVRGSTADSAASAFLTLANGTFKISGTFSGNHRTTIGVLEDNGSNVSYIIPTTAGIWLNNPNYTVTAQSAYAWVKGLLHVSAGKFNVGTDFSTNSILLEKTSSPTMIVDGGEVNLATRLRIPFAFSGQTTYNQSGGKVTTCNESGSDFTGCVDFGTFSGLGPVDAIIMSGGDLYIQNPTANPSETFFSYHYVPGGTSGPANLAGGTLHFGSAATTAPGSFTALGTFPNVILDTTVGPQKLIVGISNGGTYPVRNLNIGAGGTLEIPRGILDVRGNSFVNNGTVKAISFVSFEFHGNGPADDVGYSGSGTLEGVLDRLNADCHSVTFGPSVGNLRTRTMMVNSTQLINSGKITIGNNNAASNQITISNNGKFDSMPVFDLGPGTLDLVYQGPQTTGPELGPTRTVRNLTYGGSGELTVTGGDVTVTGTLTLSFGAIVTGSNKLIHSSINLAVGGNIQGWVDGTIDHPFLGLDSTNSFYNYFVGHNGRTPASIHIDGMATVPTSMAVTVVPATMPGLPAAQSISRYWKFETSALLSGSNVSFTYLASDINGNSSKYKIWRTIGGGPAHLCPGSRFSGGQIVCNGGSDLSGNWGVAEFNDPGPVSISGVITEASGNPIRNAFVTLSAEGKTPVTIQTGSLGSYIFPNLDAGILYTVTVSAKRHRFSTMEQQLVPMTNLTTVNFAANPAD